MLTNAHVLGLIETDRRLCAGLNWRCCSSIKRPPSRNRPQKSQTFSKIGMLVNLPDAMPYACQEILVKKLHIVLGHQK
jgi:hypothetical protein